MIPAASLPPCSSSARYEAAPMRAPVQAAALRTGLSIGSGLLVRLFDAMAAWQERASDRSRLARMDERMLHDIGVDAAAAFEEAGKPFWRR